MTIPSWGIGVRIVEKNMCIASVFLGDWIPAHGLQYIACLHYSRLVRIYMVFAQYLGLEKVRLD